MKEPLIFDLSSPGRRACSLPAFDAPAKPLTELVPQDCLRQHDAELPEVSEIDVVRHVTRLSQLNFSVDTHFYPLGSCTMKYNPKINDRIASLPGFANVHPYQPASTTQGVLAAFDLLEQTFCAITGMDAFTLQPAAGAHGELTGLLLIRAYHTARGNPRRKVIVPDSAHGTNPSSAHLAGYQVVTVPSNKQGEVDIEKFREVLDEEVAAVMLTNPSTHGVFETHILEIAAMAHKAGALLYYDGANLNALVGLARPGDMGFDVVHLNVHKTFGTPHGGGGPGAGPVGVKKSLEPFLPTPRIARNAANGALSWSYDRPQTIGKMRTFHGSTGILIRALTYILAHGAEGLRRVSEVAIINANYIKKKLKDLYDDPFPQACMHETVLSAKLQKKQGSSARDIAKRLLDFGFHAPTIYFPMTVPEALMIEPTETESRETLNRFISAMRQIAEEIAHNPETLHNAPFTMPVTRVDEVKAARELDVNFVKRNV
ncbi:MAG: aminomethyl-transferring glycine dehydrogenase subunit GcvPB [Verrucomicrobia bacterium]|nr:aminomethyl-transferring glycine dehydrogenase subunit GcvPB [Verrucomicrobiota bacterium]